MFYVGVHKGRDAERCIKMMQRTKNILTCRPIPLYCLAYDVISIGATQY